MIETRAKVIDSHGGQPVIMPDWIASDPAMVTVSPAQGSEVRITVLRPGQSSVRLVSQGVGRELGIKAVLQGQSLVVEISQ